MSQTRSGINRALMWLRKTLEITEETDSPQILSELLRPTIDVFGWERLRGPTVHDTSGAGAPNTTVNGPVTPDDVLRLVLYASIVHTEAAVSRFLFIQKEMPAPSTAIVGITSPKIQLPPLVNEGADRWIYLEPGSRLQGVTDVALIAGALVLDINFIDLPIGEYIA